MRVLRVLAMVCLCTAAAFILWAGWPTSRGPLVFRPLSSPGGAWGILVRFGVRVDNPARDYPASFYASYLKQCSGTLIGRNTILISAHCLSGTGPVEIQGPYGRYDAECEPHPSHSAQKAYDVGLCRIAGGQPIDAGFEQIARPPYQLSPKEVIRVTGWGYEDHNILGRWWIRVLRSVGAGGDFRVGEAEVRESVEEHGPSVVAIGRLHERGRVALEPGDSGGAAYVGQDAQRRIIGTNACGGSGCGEPGEEAIVLASLLAPETVNFIAAFAKRHSAHICGFDAKNDTGCHQ